MEFALNRIACPDLSLEELVEAASEMGLKAVELRNDIPGRDVLDSLDPAAVARLCSRYGVRIATINAVQRFDLAAVLQRVLTELGSMAEIAQAVGWPAIVLCPNNDSADARSCDQRFAEAVSALEAAAPVLQKRGLLGLIEPLGFAECSMRSKRTVMEAIEQAGAECFRIVHDTFHHFLGPDTEEDLKELCGSSLIGLVHLSGVEEPEPTDGYRDGHRVLVGPEDRTEVKEQVHFLERFGYHGLFSFEPFAGAIQRLPAARLVQAVAASRSYLGG